MQKTLGGDRLGSGKKMKVELHGYERSNHDLGYLWRSTMSAGTLVPFMSELALPGDTFDIDLNCDIKTHPTVGPLFGSYKVQLDVFSCPIRLYQAQLHNNKLGIGMQMANVKLPQIELTATIFDIDNTKDLDNSQINPSCILSYLGIRGVGINLTGFGNNKRQFNAIPLLAYWEIYKNYYANKQEEIGAVIHTPPAVINDNVSSLETKVTQLGPLIELVPQGTTPEIPNALGATGEISVLWGGAPPNPDPRHIMLNTNDGRRLSLEQIRQGDPELVAPGYLTWRYNHTDWGNITLQSWQMITPFEVRQEAPVVTTFQLANIDIMRDEILQYATPTNPFIVNEPNIPPYSYVLGETTAQPHMLGTQEGLGLKTYQSDLFNNWLQTDWIDGTNGITEVTAIDTTGGSFTLDTLNLSKKVYDMLNRIAVSGGSYDDWLDAVYTENRFHRAESPVYLGGLIKELIFQEVVSNSGTSGTDTGQPLGTLAGKGVMSQKHKGGHVIAKIEEPSYIIGIISLTPRIDYSQGNKWDTHLLTMDDLHKPALDEIGFQDLITEQMAWWTTQRVGADPTWIQQSAGKQPAWLNYMTNVNQTRGNFAISQNEMFMTLNRRYEPGEVEPPVTIKDLTTYIDPSKFNHIFAQTALDAQNFWAQISVDITARRKMSAKIMPNL